MKRWMISSSSVLAVALFVSATASAQQAQPKTDCKASAPQKVEGQVVNVDPNGGKVTVREKDGKTHEFQAAKETLQPMKPGDRLEATLREAPKC
jgi:hypothetical protein